MRFAVSVFFGGSVRTGYFLMSGLCICLLSCFTSVSRANPRMVWDGTDSTSIQRTDRDLSDLKKHVQLSKSQEDYIYNMFLGKHQYLEVHEATGSRWELRVETNKRKLRELLGEDVYLKLAKAGLIEYWFDITQGQ